MVTVEGLHRIKAFSASQTVPPVSRLGMYKKLGKDTGQTTPADQRGIPDHMVSPSAIKLRGGSFMKAVIAKVLAGIIQLEMCRYFSFVSYFLLVFSFSLQFFK